MSKPHKNCESYTEECIRSHYRLLLVYTCLILVMSLGLIVFCCTAANSQSAVTWHPADTISIKAGTTALALDKLAFPHDYETLTKQNIDWQIVWTNDAATLFRHLSTGSSHTGILEASKQSGLNGAIVGRREKNKWLFLIIMNDKLAKSPTATFSVLAHEIHHIRRFYEGYHINDNRLIWLSEEIRTSADISSGLRKFALRKDLAKFLNPKFDHQARLAFKAELIKLADEEDDRVEFYKKEYIAELSNRRK